MGESKKLKIQCYHCAITITKRAADVNLARKRQKPLFCGHACSNKFRAKCVKITCEWCKNVFIPLWHTKGRKFCSSKCSGLYGGDKQYVDYIAAWKKGLKVTGKCNVISRHIRRYLFEKYNHKCCECGWSKKHPITNNIPLEVDHIDGDWTNNEESNLRLVCPNCHSLSPNFRALNKGKGREHHYKTTLTKKVPLKSVNN